MYCKNYILTSVHFEQSALKLADLRLKNNQKFYK